MYAASGKNVKTAATKMVAYERIRNTDNTFGKQKKLMLNATSVTAYYQPRFGWIPCKGWYIRSFHHPDMTHLAGRASRDS